jgi:PleD family two-component response regulator
MPVRRDRQDVSSNVESSAETVERNLPTLQSDYVMLIVDGPNLDAISLRDCLEAQGATVYVVVDARAAMAIVRSKRIDVAMLGLAGDQVAFKRELSQYGVQIVRANASGYQTDVGSA